MPLRRQSSDILYPFTPDAEAQRSLIKGIVDAFLIVHGDADETGSGITDYKGYLFAADIGVGTNTYTFKVEAPPDYIKTYTFEVPRGLGIVKVESNEDSKAFIMVDSSNMNATVETQTGLATPLEPSRISWHLGEVRSIRFINEYRDADPATRAGSIASHPDTTLIWLGAEYNSLELVDGYNCELSYDEETTTLLINGGVGLGKGVPDVTYWDKGGAVTDEAQGVRSINGVNDGGNAVIEFGDGIEVSYGAHSISMAIRD